MVRDVKGTNISKYHAIAQKINEARGSKVKLANETYARFLSGNKIVISLFGNDIIKITPDGVYELNNCDYPTNTTHQRFSSMTPVIVKMVKGEPVVDSADGTVPFFNGIKVDAAGRVLNGKTSPGKLTSVPKRSSSTKSTSSGKRRD
jgi:hypothetical protein